MIINYMLIVSFLVCIYQKYCTASVYYKFDESLMGYNAANDVCGDKGRYLTSIKSLKQNQQIIDICQVFICTIYSLKLF